jgi:ABC-type multidrug transport system fused ATPase/permease subunit
VPEQSAFQPQSPILFDQTIRANILFGVAEEDANEAWVQQSLEASTLSLDMVRSIFPPLTNTHTHTNDVPISLT